MRIAIATVVIGVMTWATGPGMAYVEVGDEYATRVEVQSSVTEIDADGNVVSTEMPEPPYRFTFAYDKTLVRFAQRTEQITATYRDVPGTPYARLECEMMEPVGVVYWQALRATDAPVAVPVRDVTSNSGPLEVRNLDRLAVSPKPARLHIRIEGPVTVTVGE